MSLRLLAVAALLVPGVALAQVPAKQPRQPTTAQPDTGEARRALEAAADESGAGA